MAGITFPSEITNFEVFLLLIITFTYLISIILARISKKKNKSLSNKFNSIGAFSGLMLFLFFSWSYFRVGDILGGIILLLPVGLLIFASIMMINEKKQKEIQSVIDKDKIKLMEDTSLEVIELLDLKKNLKIYIPCEGRGIENDPYIIQQSENLPDSFWINGFKREDFWADPSIASSWSELESNKYFIIKDLNREKIKLTNLNGKVENCTFNQVNMIRCTEMTLEDLYIKKKAKLKGCNGFTIESCNFEKITLKNSSDNHIKNCSIRKIRVVGNSINHYEMTDIPEKQRTKLSQNYEI